MENITELNLETMEKITGGNNLYAMNKAGIADQLRVYKEMGFSPEEILKPLSDSRLSDTREYIRKIWNEI